MKLWLISQSVNNGYDTYDNAVVAAKTEADAREIHPNEVFKVKWLLKGGAFSWGSVRENGNIFWTGSDTWTVPANVTAELIGNAKKGTEAGVICSSFNAG